MLHRNVARVRAAALALAAAAACGDSTGPGRGARLVLTLALPAGDSVAQAAVELTVARADSAPFREYRVWVDSAAAPTPQSTELIPFATRVWGGVVFLPGPGRHTITVAVRDSGGRVVSASASRTFRLPDTPYRVAPLPDLGYGGEALFVHAGGAVAGWVATESGRRRPALWRDGALALVPAPVSVDVIATRVNAAGDVLLRLGPVTAYSPPDATVRVRRADGAVLTVGPLHFSYDAPAGPRTVEVCCSVAADLSDGRLALAAGSIATPSYYYRSAVLDVPSGRLADSSTTVFTAVTARGQLLGTGGNPVGYSSTGPVAVGFSLAPLPPGASAGRCDGYIGRFYHESAIDLDDDGDALTSSCGNLALRSPRGSVWLDRYLGRTVSAHLSRAGGVVVGLDSAGTLTRWTIAGRSPERLRFPGGWRVQALNNVNAAGVIAARGLDAGGRQAPLLLSPASP